MEICPSYSMIAIFYILVFGLILIYWLRKNNNY